ncbi:hypothetical protein WCE41_12415 [Luteimonas sp. MJ246]|uniref:hypothetical protein n=1 Tax=Luteimonas sp. MJ174 TaxID=3129237 RepID=UPI0031BA776A
MAIHDSRQIAPFASHLEIGNVGYPDLVDGADVHRMRATFNAAEETGKPWSSAVLARRTGADACFPHQPLDAAPADSFARLLKDCMHAWAAIGLTALRMHGADPVDQRRVVVIALAGRPLLKAGGRRNLSYFRFTSRSALSSAATVLSSSVPLVTITPSRANLRQRDNMKGWM